MTILRNTGIVIASGFFLAGIALAQETKIKRSDLPPAVEKTVAEVSKDATIKGFNKEKEDGKISYEVEMVVNGHTKDVQIDPSGAVTEIEEEVVLDSLSPDVKAGLTAKAGTGKILKVAIEVGPVNRPPTDHCLPSHKLSGVLVRPAVAMPAT